MKGNIRVFARVRPMSAAERARGCERAVRCPAAAGGGYGQDVVLAKAGHDPEKVFRFNKCFTGSDQNAVFEDVRHLVQSAVQRVHLRVRQTGSGKSTPWTT